MLMPDFETTEGQLAAYRAVRDFVRKLFGLNTAAAA